LDRVKQSLFENGRLLALEDLTFESDLADIETIAKQLRERSPSRLINADEVLGTHTGPGSRFGHEVTMRQRRLSLCANPGAAGAAITPTRHNAPPRARVRRVILLIIVSRAGQIYGPSL
jgi:hypothetical protein